MDIKKLKEYYSCNEFKEEYTYSENDLGIIYSKQKTTFKIYAPTSSKIKLNLYKSGDYSKNDLISTHPMDKYKNGVWICVIDDDLNNIYYDFNVTIDGETYSCGDPYAIACGVNGKRSMVIDLNTTNPKGWENDTFGAFKPKCPVIYETHIKDFSYDENSGIDKKYRGKYLAFTITDSTLNNDKKHPTCLNYLKSLGVTHIHLLPAFDFGSVDESNDDISSYNWGYDPVNYNVPEGSYSTNPHDGQVRIKEFKEMILALHKAGIRVVMDVVYNHTYSIDSNFNRSVPYYYYRENANGTLCNGSACGNDTASERIMFGKYILNSVLYWTKEYHIDGFRFDLMGLHNIELMNEIRTELNKLPNGSNILMYGEPWAAGESLMEDNAIPALKKNIDKLDENIAIFCDSTRDAIKGHVFYGKEPGFINGGKDFEEKIKSSIAAWCDNTSDFHPKSPSQIISYVSAHDNYTLYDKLVETLRKEKNYTTRDNELIDINKLAATIVFTCQGTVFFQSGEEFARTKLGEENSYNLSPEINMLNWKRAYEYNDLVEYYKGLIYLRSKFTSLYDCNIDNIKRLNFLPTKEPGVVSYTLTNNPNAKNEFSQIFVAYNSNNNDIKLDLPNGKYQLLLNKISSSLIKENIFCEKSIVIKSKSALILGRV